jgi:SRSO17 transposase
VGLESDGRGSESRFSAYVEALTAALGHADREAPFRAYCIGLLLPGPRKSVEPMAARIAKRAAIAVESIIRPG